MAKKIEQDLSRFRHIVRGRVRKDLQKYLTNQELVGKKGKDLVTIPLPSIEIPRFTYGGPQEDGVGQGDGADGEPVGPGEGQEAGNAAGEHMTEVEVTFDELAEVIGDTLELPKIEPKGTGEIASATRRYNSISRNGPSSLRHTKRTFKQAMQRQISMGEYDPNDPVIIPVRDDWRYRTFTEKPEPEHKAVVLFMLDVSGSMGNEQKDIVRLETFWIDTWLRSQYKSVEIVYIIHDAVAREVDQDTFFHTRESGGTIISSAYKLCLRILNERYPASEWNIYPFHFSDGDNWSGNDTAECMRLLEKEFFPRSNVFCYGQVESEYGSGQFLRDLKEHFGDGHESLLTSKIEDKSAIPQSIKDFLGEGK